MRLSEELLGALLLERERHEFDREWVEGVKAAWKQLYKERNSYPGRVTKSRYGDVSPKRDHKVLQGAAKAVADYLTRVKKFLEALQQDLMINKGFWQPTRGGVTGLLAKEKSTIVRALNGAIKAIEVPRPSEYGHPNLLQWPHSTHPAFSFVDVKHLNQILTWLNGMADDFVKKADGYLTRGVWKTLRQILDTYAKDKGTDAENSWSISKGYEPTELNIGRVRVKFEDTPINPMGLDKTKKQVRGRDKWNHPESRKKVIETLIKTQALLRKRGLEGEIWYGDIHIKPHSASYAFKDRKGGQRRAGADYHPVTDSVRIFGLGNIDVGLLVHELGHRYYDKVMTKKDRDAFDKWYGEVKATSGYGATSTIEDFAEVFMEYVLGKMNLSKDQIHRLEAVLKGKVVHDEPATTSVAEPGMVTKYYGVTVFYADKKLNNALQGSIFQFVGNIQKSGYDVLKRMYRHGIVVRNPRPGYPVIDYDKQAGVLTIHLSSGRVPKLLVRDLGIAYYNSDYVKPKMRKAWEEMWRQRRDVEGVEMAAKRFGYELIDVIYGRDTDERSSWMVLWMLGHQTQPDWVDKMKNQPFEIPTPQQMHQRSRMKLVGMEWKKGPLSSALVEALCR